MPNFRNHKGLVGGLLIVAVGIILLLDQERIVSAGHVFSVFWPAFFMLLGAEDLVAGQNRPKRVWGGFVFGGGSGFLLNNLGILHIRFAILASLCLIGLGIWMLVAQRSGPIVWHRGRFQPWIRRGPGGPFRYQGPLNPPGPFGPGGPSRMGGPFTNAPGTPQGSPDAGASAGQQPPAPPQPQGSGTPGSVRVDEYNPEAVHQQMPYMGAPGFDAGGAPQDWRGWRDWQKWNRQQLKWNKRQLKQQLRNWKHGWDAGDNWQGQAQQNWTGEKSANASNASASASGVTSYGTDEPQFHYSVILSHVERHITSKNFKSGTLSAILGGFEIDLSHADIEGEEAVIYADAIFGGGEIRIPDTWHVVIEGNALFGSFMDETRQRPPEAGAPVKRLIIRGTAVFGGVSIEN